MTTHLYTHHIVEIETKIYENDPKCHVITLRTKDGKEALILNVFSDADVTILETRVLSN